MRANSKIVKHKNCFNCADDGKNHDKCPPLKQLICTGNNYKYWKYRIMIAEVLQNERRRHSS
jgi:hypothetical protein